MAAGRQLCLPPMPAAPAAPSFARLVLLAIAAEGMLTLMDDLGVATGILCAGMDRSAEHALAVADEHPGRFLVALGLVRDGMHPGAA